MSHLSSKLVRAEIQGQAEGRILLVHGDGFDPEGPIVHYSFQFQSKLVLPGKIKEIPIEHQARVALRAKHASFPGIPPNLIVIEREPVKLYHPPQQWYVIFHFTQSNEALYAPIFDHLELYNAKQILKNSWEISTDRLSKETLAAFQRPKDLAGELTNILYSLDHNARTLADEMMVIYPSGNIRLVPTSRSYVPESDLEYA